MNWWSTIGLVLDIVGVIVVFYFGLPSGIREHSGEAPVMIYDSEKNQQDEDAKRKAKNKMITRLGRLGLVLIGTGFLLQLIGSNTSR